MQIEIIRSADAALVMVGGVCASNTRDIHLDDVKIEGPHRDVVLISSFLEEVLRDDELDAIIAHETAHIVLGHLNMATDGNTTMIGESAMLDLPLMELEADAYSADRCGPGAVIGALGTVVNWFCQSNVLREDMVECGLELKEIEEMIVKIKAETMGKLTYRFDALNAMNKR